jgi:hypothetical protein
LKFFWDAMAWIEASPVGVVVAQTIYAFSALDMIHVAAVAFVFGTIALLDLRLMSLAFTAYPITVLARQLLPWTWIAFAIAAISGALMFTGQAARYAVNYGFQVKFVLMAIAGINVLVFHFLTYRGVAKWDHGVPVPLAAKLAGLVSLGCWVAIVFYGRFTASLHYR